MYYLYSSDKDAEESWLLILVLTAWLINDIQTIFIQSFRSFTNLITFLKISKKKKREKKIVLINPTKHFQPENHNVLTRIFLFRYWRIRNRAMAGMTWRSRSDIQSRRHLHLHEVRQRTDSVGVVPSKTQIRGHTCTCVHRHLWEGDWSLLPSYFIGWSQFEPASFHSSLFVANHRSFYYSLHKNNKVVLKRSEEQFIYVYRWEKIKLNYKLSNSR